MNSPPLTITLTPSTLTRATMPASGLSSLHANMDNNSLKTLSMSPQYNLMMNTEKERPTTPTTTATTVYDSDADDSGLSSLSSIDDDNDRRSIFQSYWKQNIKQHSLSSHPNTVVAIDDEISLHSDGSNNTYERSLKNQESPRRRSIFGTQLSCPPKQQQSVPGFRMNLPLSYRKAVSDPELHCKRLSSCLRPSKYSGDNQCNTSKNKQKGRVSFHTLYNVVDYDLPVEVWAEDGWSKYFAI